MGGVSFIFPFSSVLAAAAAADGTKVFKVKRWREKNQVIKDILEQYKSLNAELNVLPFCTQFIPMDIIQLPKYQSIIYHPSLLPRHRGPSSINWYVSHRYPHRFSLLCSCVSVKIAGVFSPRTLMEGDTTAGYLLLIPLQSCGQKLNWSISTTAAMFRSSLTVFWADDGLDTGPILLQKECQVQENDTVDTLYNRFLFPEGIAAMVFSFSEKENKIHPSNHFFFSALCVCIFHRKKPWIWSPARRSPRDWSKRKPEPRTSPCWKRSTARFNLTSLLRLSTIWFAEPTKSRAHGSLWMAGFVLQFSVRGHPKMTSTQGGGAGKKLSL